MGGLCFAALNIFQHCRIHFILSFVFSEMFGVILCANTAVCHYFSSLMFGYLNHVDEENEGNKLTAKMFVLVKYCYTMHICTEIKSSFYAYFV